MFWQSPAPDQNYHDNDHTACLCVRDTARRQGGGGVNMGDVVRSEEERGGGCCAEGWKLNGRSKLVEYSACEIIKRSPIQSRSN